MMNRVVLDEDRHLELPMSQSNKIKDLIQSNFQSYKEANLNAHKSIRRAINSLHWKNYNSNTVKCNNTNNTNNLAKSDTK